MGMFASKSEPDFRWPTIAFLKANPPHPLHVAFLALQPAAMCNGSKGSVMVGTILNAKVRG